METNLTKNKNEVSKFLLITFVITYGMGIIMFLVHKRMDMINISSFGMIQMLYPALAAIIIKINYHKDNIPKCLMNFFKLYIVSSILCVVLVVVGAFAFPKNVFQILNILIVAISLVAFILIIRNKDNSFEKINMVFKKNFKFVVLLALLYIGIKLIMIAISVFVYGNLTQTLEQVKKIMLILAISVPVGVVTSFIPFFGEEMGWRQYLQPRLQSIFGKKIGVIILGMIWGIWHLPLCIMLYSPTTPVYCIVFYIFFCILLGIFLGFVYMKTGNLWSTIIIHLINNSMFVDVSGAYGKVFTPKDLIIGVAINAVVFLPFLLTKEYKNNTNE